MTMQEKIEDAQRICKEFSALDLKSDTLIYCMEKDLGSYTKKELYEAIEKAYYIGLFNGVSAMGNNNIQYKVVDNYVNSWAHEKVLGYFNSFESAVEFRNYIAAITDDKDLSEIHIIMLEKA